MEIQAPISAKLTIKIIVVFQADFLIKKTVYFLTSTATSTFVLVHLMVYPLFPSENLQTLAELKNLQTLLN